MNQAIGSEEVKVLNLSVEQEAELRNLEPDFEPKKNGASDGKTQKEPDEQAVGMVTLLYAGLFAVLATRLGDHWQLTEKELVSLAEPTVAVVAKYYPDVKLGPEMALVAAVAVVVFPRLMVKPVIEGELVEGEEGGDKSEHRAA